MLGLGEQTIPQDEAAIPKLCMSRSRKRSTDELEQLRSENKELRSTIKSLERQIKKLNRELKNEFDVDDIIQEITEESKQTHNKCTKCGKGKLNTTELGPRIIETCTQCDHRKVIKK